MLYLPYNLLTVPGFSLTGFTLELSLPVAQAGAAHHVTVLSVAIPLLADAVVVAVVVTPLCGGSREQQVCESEEGAGNRGGTRPCGRILLRSCPTQLSSFAHGAELTKRRHN